MKSRVSFLRKQTALLLTALLLLSCCSILAFAQSVGTVKAKQTAPRPSPGPKAAR